MRHSWSISDSPDLPIRAFRKALGKNRPDTLEGGKGGSPQAPDPYVTADAQTRMNQATAAYNKALNLGNYSNPFGGQYSSIRGYDASGAPIYGTDVFANPQLQSLLNQQIGNVGNSGQALTDAATSYRALGQGYGDINQSLANISSQLSPEAAQNAQQRGQDAAYQSQAQYLNPQFAQQEESLGAKLAAQGLAPGSQAYSNAMLNFQNDKQRAYSNAQNQAIMTGSQLGTQNWQNQLAGANTNAGLFGQMGGNLGQIGSLVNQQVGLSQLPYNNLQSIASLIPGYAGPGQSGANAADITGAINNQYQGQLGAYNARQQSSNANTAALAGLAGTAAMMFF